MNDNNTTGTLSDTEDFVGRLISFFKSQPAVAAAYFGFLTNGDTGRSHLFLAVDHDGNDDVIKDQTWFIKTLFQQPTELHFVSSFTDKHLLEIIKQRNFSFYEKDATNEIHILIAKHFFNPSKYRKDLIEAIKSGTVITLIKNLDKSSNVLNFQDYMRPTGSFIPLFSTREMVTKSGMKDIPEDLSLIQFSYNKLSTVVDFHQRKPVFILNPGTAFEFEFSPF